MAGHDDPRFTTTDAEIIRHKVRKLLGHYGFRKSDKEDLRQELAFHVSMRMSQYDPARGARSTFVDRIVRNKVANLIEHTRAQKRGGGRAGFPIDGISEGLLLDAKTGIQMLDFAIDVGAAVAGLPAPLRKIAVLLGTYRPAEVARRLGLTRGQLRQRLEQIRVHLSAAGIS